MTGEGMRATYNIVRSTAPMLVSRSLEEIRLLADQPLLNLESLCHGTDDDLDNGRKRLPVSS